MRSKTLSRQTLLIAILTGFVLSPALLLYFIQQSPNLAAGRQIHGGLAPLTGNNVALPQQARSGLPVRLKIPSINVDASIEYVGLTPGGAMDVPEERTNAAWFNLGPRPGEDGGAVIAGHYGWKNGKAAVFDNLYKLRAGDKLYIEDDKGVIISFVVRESRMYDPEADASEVFGSSDGKARLNLITCEGTWDRVLKTYSKRRVVFAEAVQ